MANSSIYPPKPTFAQSVVSGIAGAAKGAISGSITGAIGGAFVGAALGGLAVATGGAAGVLAALATIGSATLGSSVIGAAVFAPIGALAGLVTNVVKSRETRSPTATDMANVAKISFAQGVQVGAKLERASNQSRFEQTYIDEKQKLVMGERQVSH